jgi:hypothetical protein
LLKIQVLLIWRNLIKMSVRVKSLLELIEKARSENKQKSGVLAYWVKIDNMFLLSYVNISFLKKDRKQTRQLLEAVELEPGFLFWADSSEGEKFYDENYDKIVEDFNVGQIKPWFNYEYKIKKTQ